jgi:hypothetical protein
MVLLSAYAVKDPKDFRRGPVSVDHYGIEDDFDHSERSEIFGILATAQAGL